MMRLNANTYAINKKTGKCVKLITDTLQSRNRRQVKDSRIYKSKTVQVAESALVSITDFEAQVCIEAEKIQRGMMKHSESDKKVLALHAELLARVCA